MKQNIKGYIYNYAKYVFFRQFIYSLKYDMSVHLSWNVGIEVREGGDVWIQIADSLRCKAETNMTL